MMFSPAVGSALKSAVTYPSSSTGRTTSSLYPLPSEIPALPPGDPTWKRTVSASRRASTRLPYRSSIARTMPVVDPTVISLSYSRAARLYGAAWSII